MAQSKNSFIIPQVDLLKGITFLLVILSHTFLKQVPQNAVLSVVSTFDVVKPAIFSNPALICVIFDVRTLSNLLTVWATLSAFLTQQTVPSFWL